MVVEEFMLVKILVILLLLWLFTPLLQKPDIAVPIFGMCLALGYLAPDFWLKGRIKKIKEELVKDLPDTVDLLALCNESAYYTWTGFSGSNLSAVSCN